MGGLVGLVGLVGLAGLAGPSCIATARAKQMRATSIENVSRIYRTPTPLNKNTPSVHRSASIFCDLMHAFRNLTASHEFS